MEKLSNQFSFEVMKKALDNATDPWYFTIRLINQSVK
jgi:hypothetical protein